MGKVLVLKQNSPEIRGCIENAGITVCPCASFSEDSWLDYHIGLDEYFYVHGLGYNSEEMSAEEQIALFIHDTPEKDIIWCKDVEQFIDLIRKCKTKK